MQNNIWRTNQGFSLIDVLIAMGLSAIAIVTTIAVISQAGKVRRIENLRTSAIAVREQLIKNMSRYDNFQETIYDSTNATQFSCLITTRNCGVTNMTSWENRSFADADLLPRAGANFNLMLAANVSTFGDLATTAPIDTFYAASNPNEGFTDEGMLCSDQIPVPSVPAPNSQCPIRVDLYWWSLCSGVCNPGLIGIKVRIKTYNSLTKQTVITPYGFRLIKSVYPNGQAGPFPVYP